MAKQELLATIRDRYRASSKQEKSLILDEFIAVTATIASMASGCWGSPATTESSSRRQNRADGSTTRRFGRR